MARFRTVYLGLTLSALALAAIEPTCAERLAAADADLSTLTAAKVQDWGVGMRAAFLDRLDSEMAALDLSLERTHRPRAARLLDLALLIQESTPGLERLGIRRLNAGILNRAHDLTEEEDPLQLIEPLAASTYYVQVETELGFRLITRWMNAGALTERFKAWNIYKIRFQFPSIQGFGGSLVIDWVPCFHGAQGHPGILTHFREAEQRWEYNLMPSGPSHGTLEKSSLAVLLEPYSNLALRKMEALGWKEASFILSKLDQDFAVTLLKMAGFEAAPFRIDSLFWTPNPKRSNRIAVRVLGALKLMHSLNATLLPSGTVPESAISRMKAEIRALPKKEGRETREFLRYVLSFSGAVSMQQKQLQYADGQPSFSFQTEILNGNTQFIEKDAERILKEHSLGNEDRSYLNQSDWTEYDLLRTLDFVVTLGLTFNESNNEWVP